MSSVMVGEEALAFLRRLDSDATEVITAEGVWRADGTGDLAEKPHIRLLVEVVPAPVVDNLDEGWAWDYR